MEKSSVPYWGLKRKGQDQGVGKKNEAEIPQTETYGGPRETERYERPQQAGLLVWAFGSSLHLNSHEGKKDLSEERQFIPSPRLEGCFLPSSPAPPCCLPCPNLRHSPHSGPQCKGLPSADMEPAAGPSLTQKPTASPSS